MFLCESYNQFRNICLLYFLVISSLSLAQIQKGLSIDGEAANDLSGHVMSMPDDKTIAIGAPNNDGKGSDAGHVRIFSWKGNTWIQKGADIDGEAHSNWSGFSVNMPDSNTVAIGSPRNNDNGREAGQVRIYTWNGSSWVQKGSDIEGNTSGDYFGYSVSMSDSNTVAIGVIYSDVNGNNSGQALVYRWDGNIWIQKGSDLNGRSAEDRFGGSVSLSDSNTLIVGAQGGTGTAPGYVSVFSWVDTAWIQKGNDILGVSGGDRFGFSVSMPDSGTLAVGAYRNNGNGKLAGHARVYQWKGNRWFQKGLNLEGDGPDNQAGWSVSMPDSKTIAIGATKNTNFTGLSRVYRWSGTSWIQRGLDIKGESTGDLSGYFLSMPDNNTIAVGSRLNSNNGKWAGNVRVFCFCDQSLETKSIQNIETCDSFLSPSKKMTWKKSGIFLDTISNKAGCDSIITTNLIINKSTLDTIYLSSCDSLISPSGKFVWYKSGNYRDTFQSQRGCDSIIEVNLTILEDSKLNVKKSICDSLISPSGKYVWKISGIYNDTLTNGNGCDSIIITDLTVYKSSRNGINVTSCDSSSSPSGRFVWKSTGVFTDTLVNSVGCDSIITIYLTIIKSTINVLNLTACDSIVSPSGQYVWTESGTYFDTIPNALGCDSIITVNLTVNKVTDLTVTSSGPTITASNNNASYQWLDCSDNYNVIPTATAQTFTATANGSYSVELTEESCVDTSQCITISSLSTSNDSFNDKITVYPNPNTGSFTINLGDYTGKVEISVLDLSGKIVHSKVENATNSSIIDFNTASGIYLLSIKTRNGTSKERLVIE